MKISLKDVKMKYSFDSSFGFYLYSDGLLSETCFIYDTVDGSIAQEELTIEEGMKNLRELSVIYPKRFILVFDNSLDVKENSSSDDVASNIDSDEIPF